MNGGIVVLDTDVLSLYRKRRLPTALAGYLAGKQVRVTFVTVGELHQWSLVHGWSEPARRGMELWLDQGVVLPYDVRVARTWGALAAGARLRGRRRPENDTWIAACCLQVGLPLLTNNRRDFADFAEHHGLRLLAG